MNSEKVGTSAWMEIVVCFWLWQRKLICLLMIFMYWEKIPLPFGVSAHFTRYASTETWLRAVAQCANWEKVC